MSPRQALDRLQEIALSRKP
jgi:hypothetical protein